MIRVLIVDDHDIVREGLKRILAEYRDVEVVGEATCGEEAIQLIRKLNPDVILMDISMPGMDGLEATKRITERWPKVKVLVLTVHPEDTYAVRILKAGALGYLQKNCGPDDLITGIRTVYQGARFLLPEVAQRLAYRLLEEKKDLGPIESLSDRELQVLHHLASGLEMKEIAAKLRISYKTVETYRARLMEKLKLRNVADLTRFAIQHKLICL
ncbi:DNA-binding response regulator [candidate division WOR-3 bacterium]|uniref:DNA-binding response regulator n=1 Tax=candidate division WOR-3 bacterium TaxID=2052148 RepID=A0A660SJ01_UNCW3|nr:MAG: DNA-binding response regulator [candidate division WOR-3 bacterium]